MTKSDILCVCVSALTFIYSFTWKTERHRVWERCSIHMLSLQTATTAGTATAQVGWSRAGNRFLTRMVGTWMVSKNSYHCTLPLWQISRELSWKSRNRGSDLQSDTMQASSWEAELRSAIWYSEGISSSSLSCCITKIPVLEKTWNSKELHLMLHWGAEISQFLQIHKPWDFFVWGFALSMTFCTS